MKKRTGLLFFAVTSFVLTFPAIPTVGCVGPSSTPFSAVSATEMTVDWVSSCSTATVEYSQIDDDPAFLSPFTLGTTGPPGVFGSTSPLVPNTLYYAQVSTSSSMAGSVFLGSTYTLANLPVAIPPSVISSTQLQSDWQANSNPAGTLYEVEISSDSFLSVLSASSTVGTAMLWNGLEPNTLYSFQVRAINYSGILTGFTDLGSTMTALIPYNTGGSSATIESPDGAVRVTIASGTFSEDFRLFLSTNPILSPLGAPEIPAQINEAKVKMESGGEVARTPVPNVISEIRAKDTLGNPLETEGSPPLSVTFVYPSLDGETVTLTGGPIVRAQTLAIYRLSEDKSLWVRLPSSRVDTSARTVTALAPGLGVFSLVGQTDTSLETAYAYPVPFLAKRGDTTITFSDLAQRATVRIYSVVGRIVQTLQETDGDGELVWDVRDSEGDALPSGVYFYLLESSADKKSGKLVIVRGRS